MKQFLTLICAVGAFTAYASNKVVIKGTAPDFEKTIISVYNFTDYVTYRERQVTSDMVKPKGIFQVEFDIESTVFITLKVEDKTAGLFVEPGKIYTLNVVYDKAFNTTQVYDKKLSLQHAFASPTELNQLIAQFNRDYEDFLLENRTQFATKKAFSKIKKWRKKMSEKYGKHKNQFLDQYITYSIANMMDAVNANDDELFKLFLKEKPVHHELEEYMKFFSQFFQKDLRSKCIAYDGLAYKNCINKSASVKQLDILLMKDPRLKDSKLRELYLLYGLNELYNDPIFDQTNVLNMVNQIYERSEDINNKLIAYNIVALYTNLKESAPAPDFKLKDADKNEFTLASFGGRYLYVNFWASWSIPSIKEMRVMEKMHKIYGKKIDFVSINCDASKDEMIKVQRKYKYKWKFLHIDDNSRLLEDYNVRVIPSYVIIGPDGKIVHAPAERPTGNADRQLYKIIEASLPKKEKYRIGK